MAESGSAKDGAAAPAEWSPLSVPSTILPVTAERPVGPTTQRRMANGVEAALRNAGFRLVLRDHHPDGGGTVVGEREVVPSPLPAGAWARRYAVVVAGSVLIAAVGAIVLLRWVPGGLIGLLPLVGGLSGLGYVGAAIVRIGSTYESDLVAVTFSRDPRPADGVDPYQAGEANFPTRVFAGRVRSFDQSSREPGRSKSRGLWSVDRGATALQALPGDLVQKLPGDAPSFETTPTAWVGGGPGDE